MYNLDEQLVLWIRKHKSTKIGVKNYSERLTIRMSCRLICRNKVGKKVLLEEVYKTKVVHSYYAKSDYSIDKSSSLHYTKVYCTTQYCTTQHYTTLRYTTQHNTTLHYTTLHYTTLHYTTLHYTTLHYTTLHCTSLREIDVGGQAEGGSCSF